MLVAPIKQSPKNRYSLTGTYTLPLDEKVGTVSLSATFTHTDKQRSTYTYVGFLAQRGTIYANTPNGVAPTTRDLGILPAPTCWTFRSTGARWEECRLISAHMPAT